MTDTRIDEIRKRIPRVGYIGIADAEFLVSIIDEQKARIEELEEERKGLLRPMEREEFEKFKAELVAEYTEKARKIVAGVMTDES